MPGEFFIVIQPPERSRVDDKVGGPSSPQCCQICDRFSAARWMAVVDRTPFRKMPAFALSVIKNGRITVIGGDDERFFRRDPVQFQPQQAQFCSRFMIKLFGIIVREATK